MEHQRIDVCVIGVSFIGVLPRHHMQRASAPSNTASALKTTYRHNKTTYRDTAEVCVLVVWVLPRLWQQAVVPVDVVGVEAELALLGVLLDRRAGLVLRRAGEGGWVGVVWWWCQTTQ